MNRKQRGNTGEDLACRFLLGKGFVISKVHYRFKSNEIDIIAEDNTWILFVECKTRTNSDYGQPGAYLSEAQERRIVEAADHYLQENNCSKLVRFDVVEVILEPELSVNHIEDAFRPEAE